MSLRGEKESQRVVESCRSIYFEGYCPSNKQKIMPNKSWLFENIFVNKSQKSKVFVLLIFFKNVSSSTTYKKNSETSKLWNYGILASANPSPNDFPLLYEQFPARFPLKGRGTRRFPLLRFDLIFGYVSIPIIPTFFAWLYIIADNFLW